MYPNGAVTIRRVSCTSHEDGGDEDGCQRWGGGVSANFGKEFTYNSNDEPHRFWMHGASLRSAPLRSPLSTKIRSSQQQQLSQRRNPVLEGALTTSLLWYDITTLKDFQHKVWAIPIRQRHGAHVCSACLIKPTQPLECLSSYRCHFGKGVVPSRSQH
jgi:hypothetical protein